MNDERLVPLTAEEQVEWAKLDADPECNDEYKAGTESWKRWMRYLVLSARREPNDKALARLIEYTEAEGEAKTK